MSTPSKTARVPPPRLGLRGTAMRAATDRTNNTLLEWAQRVEFSDLTVADTESLRTIAELAERREVVEEELTEAVRSVRQPHRSWSEIGTLLGVSKQASQRKYASKVDA